MFGSASPGVAGGEAALSIIAAGLRGPSPGAGPGIATGPSGSTTATATAPMSPRPGVSAPDAGGEITRRVTSSGRGAGGAASLGTKSATAGPSDPVASSAGASAVLGGSDAGVSSDV